MKYLIPLLFVSLTVSAQRANIREISYPMGISDSITYPIVTTPDAIASRKINKTIKEKLLMPDNPKESLRSLIREARAHRDLDYLSYTVTLNDRGILSLFITWHCLRPQFGDNYFNFDIRTGAPLQLADLLTADKADSFKTMVLHQKQRYLKAHEDDLSSRVKTKDVDSGAYDHARGVIDEICMPSVDLTDFSLSPGGLTVVDPCEFMRSYADEEPDYELAYSYTSLAPFLKPCFRTRLAAAQPDYRLIRFSSTHNSFPDTARDAGHLDGDHIFQPKKDHYDDSSVLLVIPRSFKPGQPVHLVFWYHGWHNNIDTALRFYGLARQFAASGVNAILVLPEAGKNVADSYGGKMNQKGMFSLLVKDVMTQLKKQHLAPANAQTGHIVISGHSGAFLVISNILDNGEQPIDEVFLFDALYSHVPSFMNWIGKDTINHHFVHWFTNKGGGTDEVSDTMMTRLKEKGWPFRLVEESAVTPAILQKNYILFIHSPREHNVIINDPDDFRLLLENAFHLTR